VRPEEQERFVAHQQSAMDSSGYALNTVPSTNRIEFSPQPTRSTGAIPKRPQSSQHKQKFGSEPSEATVQHTPSQKEQRGNQAKNEAEGKVKKRLVNRNIYLKFYYV
jgi:hypothetical protein